MSVALPQPKIAVAKIEEARVMKDAEILADAAKRIMREDVYMRATANLRGHYLDQLAKADPNKPEIIVQLQATIRAIDGLNAELEKFSQAVIRPRQHAI